MTLSHLPALADLPPLVVPAVVGDGMTPAEAHVADHPVWDELVAEHGSPLTEGGAS